MIKQLYLIIKKYVVYALNNNKETVLQPNNKKDNTKRNKMVANFFNEYLRDKQGYESWELKSVIEKDDKIFKKFKVALFKKWNAKFEITVESSVEEYSSTLMVNIIGAEDQYLEKLLFIIPRE